MIKEIADYMREIESEYCFIALRGDEKDVEVGEILDNSKDLFEGDTYGMELDGTSAYLIADLDNAEQEIERFFSDYLYHNISVVTGQSYSYGDDQNEVIIPYCKVLRTWSR